MKRITRYDVVVDWDANAFINTCQEKIDGGWILRGPLIVVVVPDGFKFPNGNMVHTLKYQNFVMYEPSLKTDNKEQHHRDIRIESSEVSNEKDN